MMHNLLIVGMYIIIISLSFPMNAIVLIVFMKQEAPLIFHEKILMSLCLCDLLRALFGYIPEVAMIDRACNVLAFIITFLSLSSIAHLSIS